MTLAITVTVVHVYYYIEVEYTCSYSRAIRNMIIHHRFHLERLRVL